MTSTGYQRVECMDKMCMDKILDTVLDMTTLTSTFVDTSGRPRILEWAVQTSTGPTLQGAVCSQCGDPTSFHMSNQGCCAMTGDVVPLLLFSMQMNNFPQTASESHQKKETGCGFTVTIDEHDNEGYTSEDIDEHDNEGYTSEDNRADCRADYYNRQMEEEEPNRDEPNSDSDSF